VDIRLHSIQSGKRGCLPGGSLVGRLSESRKDGDHRIPWASHSPLSGFISYNLSHQQEVPREPLVGIGPDATGKSERRNLLCKRRERFNSKYPFLSRRTYSVLVARQGGAYATHTHSSCFHIVPTCISCTTFCYYPSSLLAQEVKRRLEKSTVPTIKVQPGALSGNAGGLFVSALIDRLNKLR
jgi:hypothetical protein